MFPRRPRMFDSLLVLGAVILLPVGRSPYAAAQTGPAASQAAIRTVRLGEIKPAAAPAPLDDTPLPDEGPLRDGVELAADLVESGRLLEALARLETLQRAPGGECFEVCYPLAMVKARVGRLSEALATAERAARMRPLSPDGAFLHGQLLLAAGRRTEAIAELRRATMDAERQLNNPRVTAAWFYLGQALAAENYLRAAEEAYRQFDALVFDVAREQRSEPDIAPILSDRPHGALELRLALLEETGARGEVRAVLEEALEQRPAEPYLQRLYARALLAQGEAKEALEYLRELIAGAQTPGARIGLLTIALDAARAAGELDAWVAEAEKSLAAGGDLHGVAQLADRLAAAGAGAEAVRLRRAVARSAPDDAAAAWSLACALKGSGELEEARELLTQFVRAHPTGDGPPAALRAHWMAPTAKAAALLAGLEDAGRGPQRDFAANFIYGTLAAAAGQAPLAEKLFAAALDARADFLQARLAWGEMLLARFDWAAAREQAAAAVALASESAAAELLRAKACAGLDRREEAEQAFRSAARLAPQDPAILVALAQFYNDANNPLAAQRYFQQAVTLAPADAEAVEGVLESYIEAGKLEVARTQLEQAEQQGVDEGVLRRARTALRFARSLFRDDHLAELTAQLAQHPNDWRTGLRLAIGRIFRGEAEQALATLQPLAAQEPENPRIIERLAIAYGQNLEFRAAIESLQMLVERYPNRLPYLASLAEAYLADFRTAEARELLARIQKLPLSEDDQRRFRQMELSSYLAFGEYDGAVALLDTWIAAQPGDDLLKALRLTVLSQAGKHDEAVRQAGEWLDADPSDPQRRQSFVEACMAAGKYKPAEARIGEWLQAAPNQMLYLEFLARVLIADGRASEALKLARDYKPDSKLSEIQKRALMARALIAAGQVDDGIAEYDALLDDAVVRNSAVTRADTRNRLLAALIEAQRYDAALERLDAWLERAGEDRLARYDLLQSRQGVLHAAGRGADALAVLEELLELVGAPELAAAVGAPRIDDARATIQNDLGYVLADQNRELERATRLIRAAVAHSPLNAMYLDSLGWVYYKTGDFSRAHELLARSVKLAQGQDVTLYDHLGDAAWRLGDRAGAAQAWKQALEVAGKARGAEETAADTARVASLRTKLAALDKGDAPAVAPTVAEPK